MGQDNTAQRCVVRGGQLEVEPVIKPRTECATVDHALQWLAAGETVVVSDVDMAALTAQLRRAGVYCG